MMHHGVGSPALHRKWMASVDFTSIYEFGAHAGFYTFSHRAKPSVQAWLYPPTVVVEQKWNMLQVTRPNWEAKFMQLWSVTVCSSELEVWRVETFWLKKWERRKGDGQTKNNMQAPPGSNWQTRTPVHSFFCTHCNAQNSFVIYEIYPIALF